MKVKIMEKELKGDQFCDLIPYYYFEMAALLLTQCPEEVPDLPKMKSVVEDIFEIRKEKLLKVLKEINPTFQVKSLTNSGSAEIN